MILLIISAFFVIILIMIVSVNQTETVCRAYAGKYNDDTGTTAVIPRNRNKTIYTVGEKVIDMSKLIKFLITGTSLEKEGLQNGTQVFVEQIETSKIESIIDSICNHFVIIKYDSARYKLDHPESTEEIQGFKARRLVMLMDNHLPEKEFIEKILEVLNQDKDIDEAPKCANHLYDKYLKASTFYQNDSKLLVSITYKSGKCKDYSFHSLAYLYGVIRYKAVS